MSKTYIITRHPGAIEWLRRHYPDIAGDAEIVQHADEDFFERLGSGCTVVGTLPVHLAARVNASGAKFYFLQLTVPPELRGKELSADEMEACGATLSEYLVLGPESIDLLEEARRKLVDAAELLSFELP